VSRAAKAETPRRPVEDLLVLSGTARGGRGRSAGARRWDPQPAALQDELPVQDVPGDPGRSRGRGGQGPRCFSRRRSPRRSAPDPGTSGLREEDDPVRLRPLQDGEDPAGIHPSATAKGSPSRPPGGGASRRSFRILSLPPGPLPRRPRCGASAPHSSSAPAPLPPFRTSSRPLPAMAESPEAFEASPRLPAPLPGRGGEGLQVGDRSAASTVLRRRGFLRGARGDRRESQREVRRSTSTAPIT